MRLSPQRHTLAILRSVIGPDMTQKELARLLNRSAVTIQKIELGLLPLSENLAEEISRQTGINLEWLLKNDLSAIPIDNQEGRPYDREMFENTQAWLLHKTGTNHWDGFTVRSSIRLSISRLMQCHADALRSRKHHLLSYKMSRFFDQMDLEFGKPKVVTLDPEEMPKQDPWFKKGFCGK